VFSIVMISTEPQGERVHGSPVAGHQQTKGVHVSSFGSRDEFSFCGNSHSRLSSIETVITLWLTWPGTGRSTKGTKPTQKTQKWIAGPTFLCLLWLFLCLLCSFPFPY